MDLNKNYVIASILQLEILKKRLKPDQQHYKKFKPKQKQV